MYRVRLVNKDTFAPLFPVSGKSGKFYGHGRYIPSHGGAVFEMSLEDYTQARFDIVGNAAFQQQWVPEFYEDSGFQVISSEVRELGARKDGHIQSRIEEYNELRKRAKAAGVWKPGMKKTDIEKALAKV